MATTETTSSLESSINLIDFNISTVNNYSKPLIPAPNSTYLILPPRDSLENNPFDKVFKESNRVLDPFDVAFFQKTRSESDLINEKTYTKDNRKFYSESTKIRTPDSRSTLESSGLSTSIDRLRNSVFESPHIISDISAPSNISEQLYPDISPIGCYVTPPGISVDLNRSVAEIRESIAKRVSRCFELSSPAPKEMKRASSVGAISKNIDLDSILNNIRSFKKNDSFSKLNNGFLGTSEEDWISNTKSNTEYEFDTMNTLDKGFLGSNDMSPLANPMVLGRRAFSARRPNRYEMGVSSEEMLRGFTNKKINFKERLEQLTFEEELENHHPSPEKKNLSIYEEAQQIAEEIEAEANCDDISQDILTTGPNWDRIDDLEKDLQSGPDIFKKIDKLFQPTDMPQPNVAKVLPNHRILQDVTNSIPKPKVEAEHRFHTIELLENLTQLLKNEGNNRSEIKKKLRHSLANILNDTEEDLDSTPPMDDDFVQEPVKSASFVGKSAGNDGKRARAMSCSTSMNAPKSVKAAKPGGFFQKLNQKLRPKRNDDKTPQCEVAPVAKKGPIKAVIPMNNMAKETKKVITKAKTFSNLRPRSSLIASSTPKTEVLKVKPVTQSTPINQFSKRRPSSSTIGCSPISK